MAHSKTRHCFSFALKFSCSSAGFRRWPWGSKTSIVRESKPSELKASLKFLKQSEKVLEVTAFPVDESAFDLQTTATKSLHCIRAQFIVSLYLSVTTIAFGIAYLYPICSDILRTQICSLCISLHSKRKEKVTHAFPRVAQRPLEM